MHAPSSPQLHSTQHCFLPPPPSRFTQIASDMDYAWLLVWYYHEVCMHFSFLTVIAFVIAMYMLFFGQSHFDRLIKP